MPRQNALYDFNSLEFLKVCFMGKVCYMAYLENISYVLGKNMYFTIVGWNVLQISTKGCWLMVLFSSLYPCDVVCMVYVFPPFFFIYMSLNKYICEFLIGIYS